MFTTKYPSTDRRNEIGFHLFIYFKSNIKEIAADCKADLLESNLILLKVKDIGIKY